MQTRVPATGELVWIRHTRWRVVRAARAGDVVRIDASDDARQLTFLAPFDRAVAIDRRARWTKCGRARACARLAGLISHATSARLPAAAIDADLVLLPYQLEATLALINGTRRILIADDVGLGKTVQAGLAIAETLRRRAGVRVLIIVPSSLRHQWASELDARFGIKTMLADASQIDRFNRQISRNDSPWQRAAVWIASMDYLKQPHVIDAISASTWDLVVADEAHTLCGDSARYHAGDSIARGARAVILLTATPHSGDDTRFGRLLDFGAAARGDAPITVFRRTRAQLAVVTRRRVRWTHVDVSSGEHEVFDTLERFERAMLHAATRHDRLATESIGERTVLLLSTFRKRALSSMSALVISLRRRLESLITNDRRSPDWQQAGLDFGDEADLFRGDELQALSAESVLDPSQEALWLRRLQTLGHAAAARESRIARLLTLLRRTDEPVVVFTEFRDTLDTIARHVGGVRQIAAIHGGLPLDEQQRAIHAFLSGAATVLVATDVASQGLNLQLRARWVINFDLPWNPARLEQRAGRVDRIGQRQPIHITSFVFANRADHHVLENLATRALIARRALHADDVLSGVLPDERGVRQLLLTGHSPLMPPISARTLEVCRVWARLGRAACRDLDLRRRLRRRWREPGVVVRRPITAEGSRNTVLVFSVVFVGAGGAELERRVVAVGAARRDMTPSLVRAAEDHIRARIGVSLAARRRRIERWLQARASRLADAERARLSSFDERQSPVQPGLFERRAVQAIEKRKAFVGERLADAASRLAEYRDNAVATVGAVTLEIIFLRRDRT